LLAAMVVFACGSRQALREPTPRLAHGTQRVAVNGGEISIDVRGEGPVCLAHPGGPGVDSTYLHIPALEQRFTVVYIDPLGTGSSSQLPAGQAYSVERDAEVVETVRAKLDLDHVCLIGHSYGGFVVLKYAVEHPDRVRGLLLYSTSPTMAQDWQDDVATNMQRFKDQPWFSDAIGSFGEIDAAQTEDAMRNALAKSLPLYFADWTGRHTEYESELAKMKLAFAAHQRRSDSDARYDVRGKLGQVRAPAVVIAGDADFICGVKPSQWIADSIAGSKLIVIEHAGHFAHLEQPAAFQAALDTFAEMLRRASAGPGA
jgi:proline iminopeptidase